MHASKIHPIAVALLALAGSVLVQPESAAAQQSSWLPWLGCWEGAAANAEADESDTYLVCFQPTANDASVEILTYDDSGLVATEEMAANGADIAVEEGGCSGTRTAHFSELGSRVFLRSSMDCGDAVTRTTRGILAFAPRGDRWVEIQSVQAGSDDPLIGIRTFTPASASMIAEQGIADPAADRGLAVRTARAGAGGALTPAGLVEIAEEAGPEAASAFLVERGETLGVDARTLQALADRGVPGEVLDVAVAVSYPERFQISDDEGAGEPEIREVAQRAQPDRGRVDRNAYGYSPWRFSYGAYWDPLWYDPFGYQNYLRYGRYGCFGCYGYGGLGYYDRPGVIVIDAGDLEPRPRLRLSRERGVVDGSDTDGSSQSSTIRSGSTTRDRTPRPSRTRTNSGSSNSGSSSASPSRSGGSGGGGGDVRRARPR